MQPIYEAYKQDIVNEGKAAQAYKKYRKYLIDMCKKNDIQFSSSNDNYDLILKLEKAGVEIE